MMMTKMVKMVRRFGRSGQQRLWSHKEGHQGTLREVLCNSDDDDDDYLSYVCSVMVIMTLNPESVS